METLNTALGVLVVVVVLAGACSVVSLLIGVVRETFEWTPPEEESIREHRSAMDALAPRHRAPR